tara:strand:- start:2659 stop:2910 length:252 start_codon:yes stop_codon:yes gene_type:complete
MQNKEQISKLKVGTQIDLFVNIDNEEKLLEEKLTIIRNNEEDISFGVGKSKLHLEINEDGSWFQGEGLITKSNQNYFFIKLSL